MKRLTLTLWLLAAGLANAQTYKLGVPPHTHPSAALTLEGGRLTRGPVKDDAGFKLRFHILKDGKSHHTQDARASESVDLPVKEAGQYAAVLELFYPSYKPGKDQKGHFKAISPYFSYRVESAEGPLVRMTPEAALILECGKEEGKTQEVRLDKGYGHKLIQGKSVEAWPATVERFLWRKLVLAPPHAWMDAKQVRFDVTLPPETPGTMRLFLLDGDAAGRKSKVTIQGRSLPEAADFATGKWLELPLSSAETKAGKVEVSIEKLGERGSAVISGVEFVPAIAR